MRNKISVLYYPDFEVDFTTLKKAILLFDELDFMDRPSMMFDTGPGQFGTVGAASPLRQFEASFRDEGVPLYVHNAPMGIVGGDWYESIKADVNDKQFLTRFQAGLSTSPVFRRLQIAEGNYGAAGNHKDVAQKLIDVEIATEVEAFGTPMSLFENSDVKPFDLSSPKGCAKQLIADAMICSAKLNFALDVGSKEGFVPLADSTPYGDLLGAKYARAINSLNPPKNKIQVTDLSFAIFDELISNEIIEKLSMEDAVRYRKESQNAREEFLEHMAILQAKQTGIGIDGDYAG